MALALGGYYWLFVFGAPALGGADPDRYYHLALARLVAEGGLPRTLPQAEDLGWGGYFPDKEFLFHVLGGGAWSLGGARTVLWLVPAFGIAVVLSLYSELVRRWRPLPAAVLSVAAPLLTVAFLFRMSLLRPHLLAVLLFCLLLLAVLRERPRLAALAAAAFALSYHAFYIVGLVVAAAWLLRAQPGMPRRLWAWCLGGLAVGILLNPYFPSNIVMSFVHLKLALGQQALPAIEESPELIKPSAGLLLSAYGFVPASVLLVAVGLWRRKPEAGAERTGLLFLLLLSAVFCVLATKSLRAMEYGVPCAILLCGLAARVLAPRLALPLALGLLLGCQGWLALQFYRASWLHPVRSGFREYAALLRQVPAGSHAKVFNCEWETGAFVLYERPDLRFVDLLEPDFLWRASPTKYNARLGLVEGAFADPRAILRGAFDADYVLCGARHPRLVQQMQARPQDFSAAPGSEHDAVRLFAVRPD